jgi:hypothetical protein
MIKGGLGNAAPTVAITNPVNGATFVAPANIAIEATANDTDGTIARVDFYQGSTLLGSDAVSPYSFTWNSVPAGTYNLTAVATDNANATTTSTAVTVTVNNPGNVSPTVSLTSPASGATFTAPASITLNASAADGDGSVSRVDFFAGATMLGTDFTSPYSFEWTGVAAGNYSLTAKATDNLGATTTSAAVPVTVNPAGGTNTVSLRQGVNGYTGMIDTTIRSDTPKTNYGSSTTLLADGSPAYAILLKWNLTAIPAGKTVTSVTLTFNVMDTTSQVYELYALKRSWSESNANWTRAAGGNNWQVAGASGANDRETTVLGTLSPTTAGASTITLNAAGISKVQSWLNNPSTNLGFIIQDYTVSDGIDFTSSEGATSSQRPMLTITYQ